MPRDRPPPPAAAGARPQGLCASSASSPAGRRPTARGQLASHLGAPPSPESEKNLA